MKQHLAKALLYLLAYTPWWMLRGLASLLGKLLYRLEIREVRNVRANLAIAFPDKTAAEREQLLKETLFNTLVTYLEMPRIWINGTGVAERVDENGINAVVRDLLKQGKGLVIAAPHHGNWELLGYGFEKDLLMTGLYRPPRMQFLEAIMRKGRAVHPNISTVPTDIKGIKGLYLALKRQETVVILPDQVPKQSGAASVVAPFYGRESWTMTLLGKLAGKYGSPVMFVWVERQPDHRYKFCYFMADEQIADRNTTVAATSLNRNVERVVAERPAQYQWVYRRYAPVDETQSNPYR